MFKRLKRRGGDFEGVFREALQDEVSPGDFAKGVVEVKAALVHHVEKYHSRVERVLASTAVIRYRKAVIEALRDLEAEVSAVPGDSVRGFDVEGASLSAPKVGSSPIDLRLVMNVDRIAEMVKERVSEGISATLGFAPSSEPVGDLTLESLPSAAASLEVASLEGGLFPEPPASELGSSSVETYQIEGQSGTLEPVESKGPVEPESEGELDDLELYNLRDLTLAGRYLVGAARRLVMRYMSVPSDMNAGELHRVSRLVHLALDISLDPTHPYRGQLLGRLVRYIERAHVGDLRARRFFEKTAEAMLTQAEGLVAVTGEFPSYRGG